MDEYLVDLNATQAAIRAGYSAKTARQQGARLLTNVDVQEAITARQKDRVERVELQQDDVLNCVGVFPEETKSSRQEASIKLGNIDQGGAHGASS